MYYSNLTILDHANCSKDKEVLNLGFPNMNISLDLC